MSNGPANARARYCRAQVMGLEIVATVRPAVGDYIVVVSGDIDAGGIDIIRSSVGAGLATGMRTVLRLDGVLNFGSAASRLMDDILSGTAEQGQDFCIDGVPRHVQRVLEITGVSDERIRTTSDAPATLSPAVFDAVMTAGVLRTREAICVTTADVDDPRIVFVNEAFTTLTGYRADDVLGRNPRLLQGPLTDREVIERLKATLRSGEEFNGEAVNYRADGNPFWMNWRILPFSYGLTDYFIALQRDGTRLRQLSRHTTARDRLSRIINASDPPVSRREVLEALGRAVEAVVGAPDAAIATAVTRASGEVEAANLEGSLTETIEWRSERVETFERDETASVHLPFDVGSELRGHLRITGLTADWLQLIDIDHLIALCEDCANPLLNAST